MTDGVELATAYVSLTVSARGIEGDLRREISKPIEQAAAQASRAARGDIEGNLAKVRPDFGQVGTSLQKAATEATAKAKATISKGLDNLELNSGKNLANGLQLLTGAGVATLGLKKLADAAGDYGEQQSKANVILGKEGAAAAEKFAASATKSAGLSKTAALTATSTFAGLGKVAGLQDEELSGFSTGLTQLAGDLASFNNSTVEDAIGALGSGLRGEAEPLRAFNVLLDDATLKQKAMELGISDGTSTLTTQQKVLAAHAAILEQTTDAQGDFVRTGDSFANQQRTLTAEVENLKTELGQGLLPVASKVTGALSSVVGGVSDLPGPVKDVGTEIGLLGVGLTGIVGIGSTVAGAFGKMLERFTTTTTTADGTTRSLNKMGGAMKATSIIFAGIAAAEIFSEIANQINGIEEKTQRVNDELKILGAEGAGGLAGDEAGKKFQEQFDTKAKEVNLGIVFGDALSTLKNDPANAIRRFFGDQSAELTRGAGVLKRTLESIQGDDQKLAFLDYVERQSKGLDKSSDEYKINSKFVKDNRDALELHAKAAEADTKKVDANAQKIEDAALAYQEANDALKQYTTDLKLQGLAYDANASAATAYGDAIERSTGIDDQLGSAVSLSQAGDAFLGELSNLPKNIDATSIALGTFNSKTNGAVQSVLGLADASSAYLQTLIAQGNYTGARDQATQLRNEVLKNLETFGITGAAAREYIEILGLTPEQVETAILLSGAEEAKFKLEVYIGLLEGQIPPEVTTLVAADIAEGNLVSAAQRIEDWIRFQNKLNEDNVIRVPVIADIVNRPEEDKPNRGRPQGRALGGPVIGDTPYMVGEVGPELFVPQAAGRIIPNRDLLAAANGGGTRPAPVINQSITNAGYQETLEATVNGLRAAEMMGF